MRRRGEEGEKKRGPSSHNPNLPNSRPHQIFTDRVMKQPKHFDHNTIPLALIADGHITSVEYVPDY